jgi:FMN-dependent NADH-azoreductase
MACGSAAHNTRTFRSPEETPMTLFRLDTSINPGNSASSEIADLVEAEWTATHPGEPVVRRHLGANPLPSEAWALAAFGSYTPEPDRTPAQRDAARETGRALAAK